MTNCSCSCGNIKIRGQVVPHCMHPNLPRSENLHLRYIKNLFSIQKQSMEIRELSKIQGHPLSKVCTEVKCSNCGSAFLFFFWNGYSYFGRMHPINNNIKLMPPKKPQQKEINTCKSLSSRHQVLSINKQNENKSKLTGSLPNFFKPLILNQRVKNTSQEILIESDEHPQNTDKNLLKNHEEVESVLANDIDFELMFSNKADPIVGSYKQDMNGPFNSSFGNTFNYNLQPNSYFA